MGKIIAKEKEEILDEIQTKQTSEKDKLSGVTMDTT